MDCLKEFTITITGLRGFREAIITKGGVSVKEINPSTMESKLIKGVYFAGEVLDLDAYKTYSFYKYIKNPNNNFCKLAYDKKVARGKALFQKKPFGKRRHLISCFARSENISFTFKKLLNKNK